MVDGDPRAATQHLSRMKVVHQAWMRSPSSIGSLGAGKLNSPIDGSAAVSGLLLPCLCRLHIFAKDTAALERTLPSLSLLLWKK